MKTIRIYQSLTVLILFLCGCLSALGQSSSSFNVTVTESSAGDCKGPPCLLALEWPNDFSNNCLSDGVAAEGIEVITDADFDFTFQVPIAYSVINTNNFHITGRVYGRDANHQLIPLELSTPSPITTYTGIGSMGSINSNNELSLDINLDFIDPGYCDIYFRFTVYQVVPLGTDVEVEFELQDLYIQKCSCGGANRQNGGIGDSRNGRGRTSSVGATSLSIFPNPINSDALVVEADFSSSNRHKNDPAEISIFTLQGQEVLTEKNISVSSTGKLSRRLDVSNLAPGIYMLELRSGSYKQIRKIVRQ